MADFASSQGKIWPEASVRRERGVGTRKNKDLSIFLSLSLSLSEKYLYRSLCGQGKSQGTELQTKLYP
jgi:hypothetical protein